MCILDISKLKMYEFNYDHITPLYGKACMILFISTDDVYRDMQQNLDEYDTSHYPCEHFLYSRNNARVIGKFTDECNGDAVLEFLRSEIQNV
jgi:ABC-type thiamine transport system substrate-binding protein